MARQGFAAVEAILGRERPPYQSIFVRPLSPVIGAEIEGLDLRLDPTTEEIDELRRAYAEHHVLVFRDQAISEAEHYRVAALLGLKAEPGRRAVTARADDPATTPEPVMMAETWRADETYRRTPPAGGVLHIHRPPRLGGDMLFANMHLAHDLLSEPLKALLGDLTAVHLPDAGGESVEDANNTAEHPVVIRHPATGRPAIFVNRRHTSHIVQLEADSSKSTLDMLFRHLETHPLLTCRVRWTPEALVVWDNRCTQHLTLQDFRPSCLSGHLVSLAGDAPGR